jgi:hypothetical protein
MYCQGYRQSDGFRSVIAVICPALSTTEDVPGRAQKEARMFSAEKRMAAPVWLQNVGGNLQSRSSHWAGIVGAMHLYIVY